MVTPPRLRLLVVEDNPQDARLLKEALREVGATPEMTVAGSADDAWEMLEAIRDKGGLYPDLILLDLKLPGASGHEFLERLRAAPRMQALPVIILTSSQYEPDVQRARTNKAVAYFAKPLTLEGYMGFARDLMELWSGGRLKS